MVAKNFLDEQSHTTAPPQIRNKLKGMSSSDIPVEGSCEETLEEKEISIGVNEGKLVPWNPGETVRMWGPPGIFNRNVWAPSVPVWQQYWSASCWGTKSWSFL